MSTRLRVVLAAAAIAAAGCGSSSATKSPTAHGRHVSRYGIPAGYYKVGRPCTPKQNRVYAASGFMCHNHRLAKR